MLNVFKKWIVVFLIFLNSCATYTTPGRGVNISQLAEADEDTRALFELKPASPFPARLALVRAQASGYTSASSSGYGSGNYSVVTSRDIEKDEHLNRIASLPQVAGLAPLNRLLLPEKLYSTKELRLAAARLKTDILLLYSLDTVFTIESADLGPLSLITLGFLPNKEALITTTASAALMDVRSGFLYGVAEATAKESQIASFWSSKQAVESSRLRAETAAFEKLVGEVEKLWLHVLTENRRQ